MGYYINPPVQAKEEFLVEYGHVIDVHDFRELTKTQEAVPVAWVDNGMFSAVGIAHSPDEALAFSDPQDTRPIIYWSVPASAITMELAGIEHSDIRFSKERNDD